MNMLKAMFLKKNKLKRSQKGTNILDLRGPGRVQKSKKDCLRSLAKLVKWYNFCHFFLKMAIVSWVRYLEFYG